MESKINLPLYFKAKNASRSSRERVNLQPKPNGRSADFIMAGFATGCQLACTYCYVARHRAFGNPLETYSNLEDILAATKSHWMKLPVKTPNQVDPVYWVYDIGENTDPLTPAVLSLTRRTVEFFLQETGAKPSFATKVAGAARLPILEGEQRRRARVRVSLMPPHLSRLLERGTSPVGLRLETANALAERGYEVHLNFSPVVVYEGWVKDYEALFDLVNRTLTPAVKENTAAEVIFLTHHPTLHEMNLRWNAAGEDYLWTPRWQETKTTHRGDKGVLRYKALTVKRVLVEHFRTLLAQRLPFCPIRYIF